MPSSLALAACLWAAAAFGERRQALLVGANTGWSMDRPLRHALQDAQRLAAALEELGDFAAADVKVLEDPSSDALRQALDEAAARASGDNGLFVFFYSGHADESHLHLSGRPLGLDELYARLKRFPATVRVGVLDACRSGAIVSKGGRPTSSFAVKVQDELSVKGTALLTSSGADELSQEARALQGSFFSHHLVSGLRGAADENRDGRVSLGEVYSYAASRTTLDTAVTPSGPQRPAFRFELNGRGEVFLTRLSGPVAVLDFPARGQRCWVTDLAERRLLAEVPADAPGPSQLALPAGSYVLKCLADDGYLVAALTATAGTRVDVSGLSFRSLSLSEGVLKGGTQEPAEDVQSVNKRRGFRELSEGNPEQALRTFDEVLAKDLRDSEAYRGKAQAYLALSEKARAFGRAGEAEQWRKAALRTDPRLAEDPLFTAAVPRGAGMARAAGTEPKVTSAAPSDEALARQNVEAGHPRRYQRFGVGVSLWDAHGPLSASVEWLPTEKLQAAFHLSLLSLGGGLSFRVVPRDAHWGPFFGAGAGITLAGLGVLDGPPLQVSLGDAVVARRQSYDRVAYLEGGLQSASRHWQGDLGLALGLSAPQDASARVLLYPVLSLKYFW